MTKLKISIFTLILLFFGIFNISLAQEIGNLTIISATPTFPPINSPEQFIYNINASTNNFIDFISLNNSTNKNITYQLYPVDSRINGEKITYNDIKEENPKIGKFIYFENSEITLLPYQNKTIPFSVILPKELNEEYYHGGIAVYLKTENKEENSIKFNYRKIVKVTLLNNKSPQIEKLNQIKPVSVYIIFSTILFILGIYIWRINSK